MNIDKVICILDENGEVLWWDNIELRVKILRNLNYNGRPIECSYSYSNGIQRERIKFKYLDNNQEFMPLSLEFEFQNKNVRVDVGNKKNIPTTVID